MRKEMTEYEIKFFDKTNKQYFINMTNKQLRYIFLYHFTQIHLSRYIS